MVKYNNLQESSNLHQLNANKQIAALLTSRTEVSHRNINLVATAALAAGGTGTIVAFTVADNYQRATYMGQDVPAGVDWLKAYAFGITAADTNDIEVDYFTGVEIQVFDPDTKKYSGLDTIYQEVSMNSSRMIRGQFPIKKSYKQKNYKDYFRFPEGETLERSQQQRWRLVSPDITVAPNHVEYMGTWDLQWI